MISIESALMRLKKMVERHTWALNAPGRALEHPQREWFLLSFQTLFPGLKINPNTKRIHLNPGLFRITDVLFHLYGVVRFDVGIDGEGSI